LQTQHVRFRVQPEASLRRGGMAKQADGVVVMLRDDATPAISEAAFTV
jgi:hypothetical protein